MIRVTSFRNSTLEIFAKVSGTEDFVATEQYGNDDGTPTATTAANVKSLNGHERANLSREQHGSTVKAEVDLEIAVNEGDRVKWDRDPGWLYEVTGVNRAFEVCAVTLRRVSA